MFCLLVSEVLSLADKLNRPKPATLSLVIHIYNLFRVFINSITKFQAITGPLSDAAMLVIALVFIFAKYEDKKARGTN